MMTICNTHVTFWRNFRHFLILCTFAIATSRLSVVRCGTSSDDGQHSGGEFKRFEYLSDGKINWAVADGGSDGCNSLCIIAIILSIIVLITLITCILCIWKNRKEAEEGTRVIRTERTSRLSISDYLPRFRQHGDSKVKVTSDPPENDTTSNAEAYKFLEEHELQSETPAHEEITKIRHLGGAKAWEWVPEIQFLEQQVVSLEKEKNTLTFWKKEIAMVQTNYPFFVPKTEGEGLDGEAFEVPKSAVDRRGQVLHYFEVTVMENPESRETNIAVGLATKPYPPFRLPGWNNYSISYNSIDGRKFNDSIGEDYAHEWGVGDTIGCGYNAEVGNVFFTKNGQFLKHALLGVFRVWYPTVGSTGPCTLKVNFGDDHENKFLHEAARGYGPGGPLLRRHRLTRRGSSMSDVHSPGRIV